MLSASAVWSSEEPTDSVARAESLVSDAADAHDDSSCNGVRFDQIKIDLILTFSPQSLSANVSKDLVRPDGHRTI